MEDHKPVEKEFHYKKLQEIIEGVENQGVTEETIIEQAPIVKDKNIYFTKLILTALVVLTSVALFVKGASFVYLFPVFLVIAVLVFSIMNEKLLEDFLHFDDLFIAFAFSLLAWQIVLLANGTSNSFTLFGLSLAIVFLPLYFGMKYFIKE
jgi:hypothetical protein